MVEGFGKAILGDEWNVYSVGLETHDVNPVSYTHLTLPTSDLV